MEEEQPQNTLVQKLREKMPSQRINPFQQTLKFTLMPSSTLSGANLFHIHPSTGDLRVKSRIDRESLCPTSSSSKDCLLRFSVTVMTNGQILDILQVKIILLDVNDNSCAFPQSQQTILIPEDSPPGEEVKLYSPTDVDVTYSIRESEFTFFPSVTEMFSFRIFTDSNSRVTPFNLLLRLQDRLDYETRKNYTFFIYAGDGHPGHTCQLTLSINVVDVNDHAPIFSKSMYRVNVSEDESINAIFLKVSASDKDSGQHGEVFYSLDKKNTPHVFQQFFMEPRTGELKLIRKLNHFENPVHHINVLSMNSPSGLNSTSSSRGDDALSVGGLVGRARVEVQVIDVNDHEPSIMVVNLEGGTDLYLQEELQNDLDFAIVMVRDEDTGSNGQVNCSLHNNVSELAFQLHRLNSDFKITAKRSFDYEKQKRADLFIVCQDGGDPPAISRKHVVVHIVDINDHSPTFPLEKYYLNVTEDTDPLRKSVSYFIAKVTASDADEGENGRITYSLNAERNKVLKRIRINNETGVISSNGKLDREEIQFLDLIVTATDHGSPGTRTTSAKLHIRVLDYNDEEPKFQQASYLFQVSENRESSSIVGRMWASDADEGDNSRLHFQIDMIQYAHHGFLATKRGLSENRKMSSLSPMPFRITSHYDEQQQSYEIVLLTTMPLDREALLRQGDSSIGISSKYLEQRQKYSAINVNQQNPTFLLRLVATDNGENRKTGNVTVQIQILDVNDEEPNFIFPLPYEDLNGNVLTNFSTVIVSYLEPIGWRITKLQATDMDAGENGTVNYFIVSGNEDKVFAVEATSGVFYLAKELTKSSMGSYQLTVEARDCGHPNSHSSRTYLVVEVNDSPPISAYASSGEQGNGHFYGRLISNTVNMYIIIAIIVASFVISTVLLTAICLVLKRTRRDAARSVQERSTDEDMIKAASNGYLSPLISTYNPTSGPTNSACCLSMAPSTPYFTLNRSHPPPYNMMTLNGSTIPVNSVRGHFQDQYHLSAGENIPFAVYPLSSDNNSIPMSSALLHENFNPIFTAQPCPLSPVDHRKTHLKSSPSHQLNSPLQSYSTMMSGTLRSNVAMNSSYPTTFQDSGISLAYSSSPGLQDQQVFALSPKQMETSENDPQQEVNGLSFSNNTCSRLMENMLFTGSPLPSVRPAVFSEAPQSSGQMPLKLPPVLMSRPHYFQSSHPSYQSRLMYPSFSIPTSNEALQQNYTLNEPPTSYVPFHPLHFQRGGLDSQQSHNSGDKDLKCATNSSNDLLEGQNEHPTAITTFSSTLSQL